MELRDYQVKIVDVLTEMILTKSQPNALLIAGCGTGKSIMSATVAKRCIDAGLRVLFVCDLRVLPNQMLKEAERVGLDQVGLYCAGHKFDREAQFTIAMCQTMRSRFKHESPGEIFGNIDVVIFDEAHQSRYSASGKALMDFFPDAFDLGLTATPSRTKNTEYLGQFYGHKVFAPQTAHMIETGAVLPERVFCPATIIDENLLDVRGGEYTDESQAKQTNSRVSIDAVVDGYFKHCLGVPFAAYCVNLEHARLLTEAFNERMSVTAGCENYRVEYQSGSTGPRDRAATFFKVKLGVTLGICSVGTMTVGFDLPAIGVILWCRKTMSEALYRQATGRGCRVLHVPHTLYPDGKQYYTILDFSGDVHRFGMPSDHRVFDIGPKPPIDPPDPKVCMNCGAIVSRLDPVCPTCGYAFPKLEAPAPNTGVPDEKDVQLTEIFSNASKKQRKFLRSKLVEAYQSGGHPQTADIEFKKLFRFDAPDNWFTNIMFGVAATKEQQMNYWAYLNRIKSIGSLTVRSVLFKREFGYRFQLDPLEILDVRDGDSLQFAYQRRLQSVQDLETLSIVKTAYSVAVQLGATHAQ